MRILIAVLLSFGVCGFSATGQDAQNKLPPPKPDTFDVQLTFFKGNPTGSIQKGDVRTLSQVCATLEDDSSIGFAHGSDKRLGTKEVFFGRKVTCIVNQTQPNCIQVRLYVLLTLDPNEDDPELADEVGDPLVFTTDQTEEFQLGGKIRIRLTPEDKENETWAEIKIEKAK